MTATELWLLIISAVASAISVIIQFTLVVFAYLDKKIAKIRLSFTVSKAVCFSITDAYNNSYMVFLGSMQVINHSKTKAYITSIEAALPNSQSYRAIDYEQGYPRWILKTDASHFSNEPYAEAISFGDGVGQDVFSAENNAFFKNSFDKTNTFKLDLLKTIDSSIPPFASTTGVLCFVESIAGTITDDKLVSRTIKVLTAVKRRKPFAETISFEYLGHSTAPFEVDI